MCFSWQKVQLIGTSRPAVYFTADETFPQLKKLREEQRHKSLAVTVSRACGRCQLHRLDWKSYAKGNQRVRRETVLRRLWIYMCTKLSHCALWICTIMFVKYSSIKLGKKGGKGADKKEQRTWRQWWRIRKAFRNLAMCSKLPTALISFRWMEPFSAKNLSPLALPQEMFKKLQK